MKREHPSGLSETTASLSDGAFDELVCRLVGRLEAGEAVDPEQLAAEHPAYAELLGQILPTLEAMVELRPGISSLGSGSDGSGGKLSDGVAGGALGDFRIVGEIGRGGMGVVYEAEQLSLSRRVALKVLPMAAILDPQQLKRFQNEARAAATLHHEHIVPVYSVGCDRGVHYYAMQLVEGQSLDRVVDSLLGNREIPAAVTSTVPPAPTPIPTLSPLSSDVARNSTDYFRTVARLGIEAAEALHYAHQQGIVHRDIKPSNLMVDQSGKLWVTDFGLARIETDATLTVTGSLLGTLRYMSPEQASGQCLVDQRTDIYSLGVTLYEMAALRPAFTGSGRQQLLSDITSGNLRPVRNVNPHVPIDLSIILAKATASEASERYATAEELANDLQRFLAHQPLKARPPSFVGRARKWIWRHQAIALTGGVALVLLSIVLGVSTSWIYHSRSQTLAALQASDRNAAHLRELLYTTDVVLAYQAWEKGWSGEALAILDRQRPAAGEPDRRGLEWHLLAGLAKPQSPQILAGHRGPINELAAFSDGRRLASVGEDGMLCVWDTRSGQLLKKFLPGPDPLHAVAVSPDDRFVAAGSTVLHLFDLGRSKKGRELCRSKATFESLAFTPGGERVAGGARYKELCLVTFEGNDVRRLPWRSRIESLAFLPGDGRLAVPARSADELPFGDHVAMLDGELNGVVAEFHYTRGGVPALPTVVRSSPDGRRLVVGERYPGVVCLLDASSGELVARTPHYRGRVSDVCYAPDGHAIAVAYEDGMVQHYAVTSRDDGPPWIDDHVTSLAAHPPGGAYVRFVGSTKLATGGIDGSIKIWPVATPILHLAQHLDTPAKSLAFSPDGKRLLVLAHRKMYILNSHTGEAIHVRSHAAAFGNCLGWSPVGDRIVVQGEEESLAMLLDAAGNPIRQLDFGESTPRGVAFSPDGRLVTIITSGALQLHEAENGDLVNKLLLPGAGETVAAGPRSGRLAYGGEFNYVALSRIEQDQALQRLPTPAATMCLAFSSDESILASGHDDGKVRVWQTATGKLLGELVGHERVVSTLSISPDDRTLISAAADGAIRVSSLEHCRGYGVLYRRGGPGAAVGARATLSPDGRRLAICFSEQLSGQPDVVVWRID